MLALNWNRRQAIWCSCPCLRVLGSTIITPPAFSWRGRVSRHSFLSRIFVCPCCIIPPVALSAKQSSDGQEEERQPLVTPTPSKRQRNLRIRTRPPQEEQRQQQQQPRPELQERQLQQQQQEIRKGGASPSTVKMPCSCDTTFHLRS